MTLLARIWAIIRRREHELEFNPEVQWRFHRRMCWFWLANFPLITLLFFGVPRLWIAIALFVNTIYSLYANFVTEFDGVHSSYAAWQAQEAHRLLQRDSGETVGETTDGGSW